jgi:hypothetical protein
MRRPRRELGESQGFLLPPGLPGLCSRATPHQRRDAAFPSPCRSWVCCRARVELRRGPAGARGRSRARERVTACDSTGSTASRFGTGPPNGEAPTRPTTTGRLRRALRSKTPASGFRFPRGIVIAAVPASVAGAPAARVSGDGARTSCAPAGRNFPAGRSPVAPVPNHTARSATGASAKPGAKRAFPNSGRALYPVVPAESVPDASATRGRGPTGQRSEPPL